MDIDITPTEGYPQMYDFIGDKIDPRANPTVLIILTVVIILYYLVFKYLGSSGTQPAAAAASQGAGITFIETALWGLFIFLILINGIQYFFDIDIKTSLRNIFTPVPEVDITVTSETAPEPVPEITVEKQVFHIPDNKYTYKEAKALCKAYGAELANYSEIEDAYKSGGEWCGFGWSDNQMILYPTQKNTWKNLQKIKNHQHDCGRPGINGGFVSNKKARFGVNCYGYKPEITEEEREIMNTSTPYPLTPGEKRFEKEVRHYRKKLPEILVSPFNYSQWSQI